MRHVHTYTRLTACGVPAPGRDTVNCLWCTGSGPGNWIPYEPQSVGISTRGGASAAAATEVIEARVCGWAAFFRSAIGCLQRIRERNRRGRVFILIWHAKSPETERDLHIGSRKGYWYPSREV